MSSEQSTSQSYHIDLNPPDPSPSRAQRTHDLSTLLSLYYFLFAWCLQAVSLFFRFDTGLLSQIPFFFKTINYTSLPRSLSQNLSCIPFFFVSMSMISYVRSRKTLDLGTPKKEKELFTCT